MMSQLWQGRLGPSGLDSLDKACLRRDHHESDAAVQSFQQHARFNCRSCSVHILPRNKRLGQAEETTRMRLCNCWRNNADVRLRRCHPVHRLIFFAGVPLSTGPLGHGAASPSWRENLTFPTWLQQCRCLTQPKPAPDGQHVTTHYHHNHYYLVLKLVQSSSHSFQHHFSFCCIQCPVPPACSIFSKRSLVLPISD